MSRSTSQGGPDELWPEPPLRALPGPQPRDVIRKWDLRAIEEAGIPGAVLMENAGAGAARLIVQFARREPEAYPEPFWIWCGPGNNGGDGFVVARYLLDAGLDVRVRVPESVRYTSGTEAHTHFEVLRRLGVPRAEPDPGELREGGTVIDALFGTGLSRPLEAPWLQWVRALNASGRSVFSLDIPSGLHADTGEALGEAVRARHTITFAAAKLGFALGAGPERCGAVHVVDIGIPERILSDR